MEQKRKQHVDKYLINDKNIDMIDLRRIFPTDGLFVMDTESCFKHHNFEEVSHGVIDMTKMKPIKKSINKKTRDKFSNEIIEKEESVWNKDFDKEVHCYAYAIGNTESDYVIYGTDLKDMFDIFNKIIKANLSNVNDKEIATQRATIECFVHNLGWDIEFCKYTLLKLGYEYFNAPIKDNKKSKKKQPKGCFNIVENNNITYQATVTLPENTTITSTKKNKKGQYTKSTIQHTVKFIDSLKIMPKSLDQISKKVVKIDEMFLKMGESYDYDKWRPVGHILSDLEKQYLYNDIYILKEFLNQFYKPMNTTQLTASSISFEYFLEKTFNKPSLKENYSLFEEHFPDLSNKVFIYETIKNSYRGGWTQANKSYVGVTQKLHNAVSVDINSSYPAVVAYKPLPYGTPRMFEGEIDETYYTDGYNMELLTIHFDGFKNKCDDNLIGEIQVGAECVKEFGCSGTEYIHTNFGGGEEYDDVIYNIDWIKGHKNPTEKRRYTLTIWKFELDNMLENMELYVLDKIYNPINESYVEGNTLQKGYEVSNTLLFKSETGLFKDVVDDLVKIKNKGKLEGNNCIQEDAKLKMNSFYGKMGSNYEREDRKLIYNEETQLCEYESFGGFYDSNRKYYPAFASAVTAWARVNLRTTLYKVGYLDVLYWDTDSLYTRVNAKTIEERCGDILHKTELGKWDIEKEYTEFKAIGAKKYILRGHDYGKSGSKIMCKCAGLPSEVRESITFSNFYLGNTFHGKKMKTRVHGGYALIEGSYTLNTSTF